MFDTPGARPDRARPRRRPFCPVCGAPTTIANGTAVSARVLRRRGADGLIARIGAALLPHTATVVDLSEDVAA